MDILMPKKEILRRLNNIRIKPSGLKRREYGISVKYFSGKSSIPEKRIDYQLTTDLNLEDYKGVLTINKKDIYFNQHEPEITSEILGNAISKALYPVEIYLNEKGLTTSEIINNEEIRNRWETDKERLSDKYSSEALTKFFDTVDKKLSDGKELEKSFQNDWFWNLFFHPKFIEYGDTRSTDTALFLSIVPFQPAVRFPGKQTIQKIPTDYHSFIIEFESEEMPADSYFISGNSTKAKGWMSLKVIFDLDLYHHFPMHTRAYFEVYTKDFNGNKDVIKKIQYTQYQKNTTEFRGRKLDQSSPFITGGLVVSEKNKWGFYKNEYENDW